MDQVVVLYVGRMVRDMGLDTLLSALPALLEGDPRVAVVVAGGKGDLSVEVAARAAESGGRVAVFPDIPADELPALYALADLVVTPTQGPRACGSLTALEAMATGKAVVAARVGGIPEIVDDGITGLLIPARDHRSLTEAVLRLVRDPAGRSVMGAAGRRRAESLFDAHARNDELDRVFSELADTPAARKATP
jgi:starch synthase